MRPLLRSTNLQGSRGEEYPMILKLKKRSIVLPTLGGLWMKGESQGESSRRGGLGLPWSQSFGIVE